jgi:hypothetical protein
MCLALYSCSRAQALETKKNYFRCLCAYDNQYTIRSKVKKIISGAYVHMTTSILLQGRQLSQAGLGLLYAKQRSFKPQKRRLSITKYWSRTITEIFFYTPLLMIFYIKICRGNYWYKYTADMLAIPLMRFTCRK